MLVPSIIVVPLEFVTVNPPLFIFIPELSILTFPSEKLPLTASRFPENVPPAASRLPANVPLAASKSPANVPPAAFKFPPNSAFPALSKLN